MRHPITLFSLAIVLFAMSCQSVADQDVALNFPQELPQAQFASEAISKSLVDKGLNIQDKAGRAIYLLTTDDNEAIKKHGFSMPSGLKEEGFSLQVNDNVIGVIGFDAHVAENGRWRRNRCGHRSLFPCTGPEKSRTLPLSDRGVYQYLSRSSGLLQLHGRLF